MTKLYIVSTPYHLLISVIKTLLSQRIGKDIIIFMYKSQVDEITIRNSANIFSKVYLCKRFDILSNLLCIKYKFNHIPYFSHLIKNKYGFDREFFRQKEIFIYNDNSYLGCLLNFWGVEYNLIEDGLNMYKNEDYKINLHNKFYNFFGLKWDYFGKSKYTKSIEVNDANDLCIKHNDIVAISRSEMFKKLGKHELDIIAETFEYTPIKHEPTQNSTLLLTDPLSEDGIISHSKKIKLYRFIASEYSVGTLYIKAHPREKEDYSKIFPTAIIIKNNRIPFEIYMLMENFHFNRVISAGSTIMDAITCADKKIQLGLEWIKNFK